MTLSECTLESLRTAARSDASLDLFSATDPGTIERVRHRLSPFLVADGGRRLVWGFAVVRALEGEPARSTYPILSLDGSDTDLLAAALRMEARTDRYTWRERAAVVTLANDRAIHLDNQTTALVASAGDVVSTVLRFLRLPSFLADAVDRERIDLRTAEFCAERDREALAILLEVSEPLSFSRRKRMLRWYCEYAAGNELDKKTERERARQIGVSPQPESAMRLLRYPVLSALDERVRLFTDRYCRGTGIRIEPPPSYEGDEVRVSFGFRTAREYAVRVDSLSRAREGIDDLLSVLF